jgi:small subunit ribosomal protein S20
MANENIAATKPKKESTAARQARSSERKRRHNQMIRNRIRGGLRQLAALLQKKSTEANGYGRQVVSWIDRAAKVNVIHGNAAARYKSRVMAQLRKLSKN